MIYKLQKKFILVSAIAVAIVIVVMFLLINVLNINSMNHNFDALSERIALGDGRFPLEPNYGPKDERPIPGDKDDFGNKNNGFINPESPFSTRYLRYLLDITVFVTLSLANSRCLGSGSKIPMLSMTHS